MLNYQVPIPAEPFVDKETGTINRSWYRFLLNLFQNLSNGQVGTKYQVLHGAGAGYSQVDLTNDVANVLPISSGGTNTSAPLITNAIMVSNGSGIVQGPMGTINTVLHGSVTGNPSYGPVSLVTDISGLLQVSNAGIGVSQVSGLLVFAGGVSSASYGSPSFRQITASDLPATSGTVQSVNIAGFNGLTITGSPITTSGTITASLPTISTGQITSTAIANLGTITSNAITVSNTVTAVQVSVSTVSAVNITALGTVTASGISVTNTVTAVTVSAVNVSVQGTVTSQNAYVTSISSATLALSSTMTPSQTAGVFGTTTNNSVNAGSIGEYIDSSVTAVLVATAGNTNLTSISLTAGDWDVTGRINYNGAGGNTNLSIGLSQTSGSFAGTSGKDYVTVFVNSATGNGAGEVGSLRILLSGTTTIYLVGHLNSIAANCDGYICARRRR